jgi:hypothetical protein
VFPVKHFADAMRDAYLADVTATVRGVTVHPFVFSWSDVVVIAIWGVVGLVLAARFFSWEPRR